MTQAQQDALALLLPPDALTNWLSKFIANKLSNGQPVPEAYTRWLYRVQMIRLNVFGPEVRQLTDEECNEIYEALESAENSLSTEPEVSVTR